MKKIIMTPEKFKKIMEKTNMSYQDIYHYTGQSEGMLRNYASGANVIPDYIAQMMIELEDEL